jgi:hypothetical protein
MMATYISDRVRGSTGLSVAKSKDSPRTVPDKPKIHGSDLIKEDTE